MTKGGWGRVWGDEYCIKEKTGGGDGKLTLGKDRRQN